MFRSALNIGLLLAVVAVVAREAAGAGWNYTNPASWQTTYTNCGGRQQSPININRFWVKSGDFFPIQFHNYDVLPTTQAVTNDGHTVKVDITSTSKMPFIAWLCPFLSTCKYNFAQYHFHWGSVNSQGSEHTIDTVRYPMEVHLVHYNDKYSSIGEAVTKYDGLAVLGIMFVISPTDNPALAPLLLALATVQNYSVTPHTNSSSTLLALASLLPSNTLRFYRYDGSLTTPTCDESVLWTVFEEPINVSEAQMRVFRGVTGSSGSSSNNYRPVQNLNWRKVEKSWK